MHVWNACFDLTFEETADHKPRDMAYAIECIAYIAQRIANNHEQLFYALYYLITFYEIHQVLKLMFCNTTNVQCRQP